MIIKLDFSEEICETLKRNAKSKNISVSELIKNIVYEKINKDTKEAEA